MRKIAVVCLLLLITAWIQAQEKIWYVGTKTINKKTEVYALQNTPQGQNAYQISFNDTVDRSVSIILDQKQNPWIFWSHFDGKTFSIQYSYWTGINWSPAFNMEQADNRWDTSIEAVFTPEGHIWATWSWEDGNDDETVYAYYNGTSWNTKKRIHENSDTPDVDPVIGLDSNQKPVIVWLRYDDDRYRLFYSYNKNSVWSTLELVYEDNDSIKNSDPMLYQENNQLKLLFKNQTGLYTCTWQSKNFDTPKTTTLPASALKINTNSIPFDIHEILLAPSLESYYKWRPAHTVPTVSNNITVQGFYSHTLGDRDPNNYIGFGDSITDGDGSSDLQGYREKLEDLLENQYGTATVVNRGVGGEGSATGLSRIADVLEDENGLYILIMEGTNDSRSGGTSVARNVEEMAEEAVLFDAIPIVATIIPVTADFNDVVALNNDEIREMIEETGYEFADIEQAFYDYGNYDDLVENETGFHPNDAGYTVMANTWFEKLVEVKEKYEKEERQLMINPPSFITDAPEASYTRNAYQIINTSTDTLEFFTTLRLPKGAIITKIKVKHFDNTTDGSVVTQLLYYDPSDDTNTNLVTTIGSTDSSQDPKSLSANNLEIELEGSLYYFFKISISPSNVSSLKFYRIEINYDI